MSRLIISPHLDDAILSLGGFLCNSISSDDMILTVFNTAWSVLVDHDYHQEITKTNLAEEKKIIEELGCRYQFLNWDECLLRGYQYWKGPFDLDKDMDISLRFTRTIQHILNKYTEVYLPAAIGLHIDHMLVFNAIIDLIAQNRNVKFILYQDLPYATYGGTAERINSIEKLKRFTLKLLETDITSTIEKKCRMLRSYKSQLTEEDILKVYDFACCKKKDHYFENAWQIHLYENS